MRVDGDGVKIESSGVRPGVWIGVLTMALIGIGLIALTRSSAPRTEDEPAVLAPADKSALAASHDARPAPALVQAQQRAAASAAPPAPVRLVPKGLPEPPAATDLPPIPPAEPLQGAPPAPASAPEQGAADDAGENQPSGLALFPPPGTKPIKRGIVVPEGIELPEGYVRHYQTTDNGKQLQAILMFHPDYQLLDDHGQPLPMPADRIVPPEMAPPGMPLAVLDVPEEQGAPASAPGSGSEDTPR